MLIDSCLACNLNVTKITKIHVLDIVKEAVVGVQELLEPSGALLRNNIDVVIVGLVKRTDIDVDGIVEGFITFFFIWTIKIFVKT